MPSSRTLYFTPIATEPPIKSKVHSSREAAWPVNSWAPSVSSIPVFSVGTEHSNWGLAGQWWCTPLISALGRQKQMDLWILGQLGLQSKSQDSQGYTKKPCLEKSKKSKKKIQTEVFRLVKASTLTRRAPSPVLRKFALFITSMCVIRTCSCRG